MKIIITGGAGMSGSHCAEHFARKKHQVGEVFNIGGSAKYTISLLELVTLLQEITGKKIKIQYGPWRKFDQKVYVSDITKASWLLNWKPAVSPREGIQRLYHWVSENSALFRK